MMLAGKRALVTGGARKMGRGIALALARAGASVAVTYRSDASEAEETVRAMESLGVKAFAVRCDVRDAANVDAAVSEAIAALGGLDLLVNNAGAFETAKLEEITAEQWDAMYATNARGPFLVAKAAHAALKASRGRIVNIGSLGGTHAWATHGHYCTSKAALHMLSQVMAKAWAPEISVNCVAPGMIVHGETAEASYAHFAEKTPMGRNGTVHDVVDAVMFFATTTSFLTGQVMTVDGGLGL